MIWKDEAFQSWVDIWGRIYGEDTDSYKFLDNVQKSFFLMNIVDNDFVNGDLNKVILDFVDENKELIDSL
jgi:methylenetetrahydrofolate reductase (NADPH)